MGLVIQICNSKELCCSSRMELRKSSCITNVSSVNPGRKETGLIKYPLELQKCDVITFTAKTMCYATDGKVEFHRNSSQLVSSPLQVVIPLLPPTTGTNATTVCSLSDKRERNCTILLTVQPYNCDCDGYVDTYNLNTTCSPLLTNYNKTGVHLNCTTANFTSAIKYSVSCRWDAPNSPPSDLVSQWSPAFQLVVGVADLVDGADVPRPPFPLAVIIVSGIFAGLGIALSVVVVVRRQFSKKNTGYTTIQ